MNVKVEDAEENIFQQLGNVYPSLLSYLICDKNMTGVTQGEEVAQGQEDQGGASLWPPESPSFTGSKPLMLWMTCLGKISEAHELIVNSKISQEPMSYIQFSIF